MLLVFEHFTLLYWSSYHLEVIKFVLSGQSQIPSICISQSMSSFWHQQRLLCTFHIFYDSFVLYFATVIGVDW